MTSKRNDSLKTLITLYNFQFIQEQQTWLQTLHEKIIKGEIPFNKKSFVKLFRNERHLYSENNELKLHIYKRLMISFVILLS